MTNDSDLPTYVAATLALHELHLDATQQAAVTEQFRLLATMAQRFMDQPDVPQEPASVYRL